MRTRIWIVVALLAVLAAASAWAARNLVLFRADGATVTPAGVQAFRIDGDRLLLVEAGVPERTAWDPGVLVVDWRRQTVASPSWRGRWLLGLLVWDGLDGFAGVPLHDRVKLGGGHAARFGRGSVEIDWARRGGPPLRIRVALPE